MQDDQAPVDGRYALERRLGAGASGEAWRARDLQDGQPVVVKLLLAGAQATDEQRERFRREVLALQKLAHPHVQRLVGCGVCPGRGQPYYATSWADGETLERLLVRERALLPARALRLVDQLLDALSAAHAAGVVHRDLKPPNLLVERPGDEDERLLVLDFGLAKHLQGGQRTMGNVTQERTVGSPRYLAPEQCLGKPPTGAADVYAVGCLLMHLLTGAPPFDGDNAMALIRAHCRGKPPRLEERLPEAPAALGDLLARCLEKKPEQRPSAAALRAELASLVAAAAAAPAARAPVIAGVGAAPAQEGLPPELEALFEDVRPLGGGASGRVYAARERSTGRALALKVVDHGGDEAARERLRREAGVAVTSPHLVAVHGMRDDGRRAWIAMELVPGGSLSDRLLRGPLPVAEALALAEGVARGLEALHGAGLVHRDVKPENVLLAGDGTPRLADFGLARGAGASLTLTGQGLGTMAYLAPEQAEDAKRAGPAADLYSLGATLYHLLAGRPPFDPRNVEELFAQLDQDPPPLQELRPDCPPAVAALVHRLLEKDPEDRAPSTRAVVTRLAQLRAALAG